jgi:hypothetical protein
MESPEKKVINDTPQHVGRKVLRADGEDLVLRKLLHNGTERIKVMKHARRSTLHSMRLLAQLEKKTNDLQERNKTQSNLIDKLSGVSTI